MYHLSSSTEPPGGFNIFVSLSQIRNLEKVSRVFAYENNQDLNTSLRDSKSHRTELLVWWHQENNGWKLHAAWKGHHGLIMVVLVTQHVTWDGVKKGSLPSWELDCAMWEAPNPTVARLNFSGLSLSKVSMGSRSLNELGNGGGHSGHKIPQSYKVKLWRKKIKKERHRILCSCLRMTKAILSQKKGFLPPAHLKVRKKISYADQQMFMALDLAPNKSRFS